MIEMYKLSGRLGNQMFQFAYLTSQMLKDEIDDVFVQSEEYFKYHAKEIKTLYGQGIGSVDKVAIHVRRGDYITTHRHFYVNLMETSYYQDAMALFPGQKFLVFSDDIEWCKKQEIFKNCEFSEGNTDVKDLNLMASCKGVIMANSSFSWWGAYLSKGKVVAPLQYYIDGVERTKLLDEWIKI